jgi:hypothetical protein
MFNPAMDIIARLVVGVGKQSDDGVIELLIAVTINLRNE